MNAQRMADQKPIYAVEIKASEKVTGKRRMASIAAAKRKVIDGEPYLIRRHGLYFRPNAHGYTAIMADAGVYYGSEALRYLDVEGLSVVPLSALVTRIQRDLKEAERATEALRVLLSCVRPS